MVWLQRTRNGPWIDLNKINYIWISDTDGQFFLKGLCDHDDIETRLSDGFDTKEECAYYARDIIGYKFVE